MIYYTEGFLCVFLIFALYLISRQNIILKRVIRQNELNNEVIKCHVDILKSDRNNYFHIKDGDMILNNNLHSTRPLLKKSGWGGGNSLNTNIIENGDVIINNLN